MYFFPHVFHLIQSIPLPCLFYLQELTSAYRASLFAGYLPRVSNPISVRQCPLACLAQLQHILVAHADAPAKVCPCSGVCKPD